MEKKNCLQCGVEFTPRAVGGKPQKCCCRSCGTKYWRANRPIEDKKAQNSRDYLRKIKNPSARYKDIAYHAKLRGHSFNITLDQFKQYWDSPCYCCGAEYQGGGLDRIDNSIGYEVGNIAPCCIRCNKMKQNLSLQDFFTHMRTILNFSTEGLAI